MEFKYIECDCHSSQHTLRFMLDEEHKELYVEVQLAQHNSFLKRLILASKYLLGYTCKYGHWDVTMIGASQAKKLIKLLQKVANGPKA